MADADLAALEARARGYLRWAVFLLAMMALILVIDLQLKKSVAKLAVEAAGLLNEAVAHGQGTPVAQPGDHAAGHGGSGMDGDTRVAAAGDPGEGEAPRKTVRRAAGKDVRASGDGS